MDLERMSRPDDHLRSPNRDEQFWNYEATVKQIEFAIARIESGELELAQVFNEFAQAVEHLRECEIFLTERQQQMDLLIETLSDDPEF